MCIRDRWYAGACIAVYAIGLKENCNEMPFPKPRHIAAIALP